MSKLWQIYKLFLLPLFRNISSISLQPHHFLSSESSVIFERIFFRFRFENSFASELKNKLFLLLLFEQFPWHLLAMEMEAPKQSWRKLLHYTTYLTFSPHFLSPPLYLILSLHPLHFLFSFSKDIVFSYFFVVEVENLSGFIFLK